MGAWDRLESYAKDIIEVGNTVYYVFLVHLVYILNL